MAFEKVTIFEVPPQLKAVLQESKGEERAAVYIVEGTVYIVVTRGEKPTGGYGVRVVDIEGYKRDQDGYSVNVHLEYNDPKPDQLVTQAITYPFAIVRTDIKDISKDTLFRFSVDGTERAVQSMELLE